jgi:type VI secretion system protein VasD
MLSASADVNPDASARPSPIVVRIYQLKDEAAFAAAEFSPLFDDDQKVLGGSLISRREVLMTPGAKQTISDFAIALDAKFVGVVAAFRDIRNAQWRVSVPAGRRDLTITVDRLRVALAPAGS